LEIVVSPKLLDAGSAILKQVKMGGISDHPDLPADDKCNPEQMRGTNEHPKGRRGGQPTPQAF